jgi:signal transduction histidine kinase
MAVGAAASAAAVASATFAADRRGAGRRLNVVVQFTALAPTVAIVSTTVTAGLWLLDARQQPVPSPFVLGAVALGAISVAMARAVFRSAAKAMSELIGTAEADPAAALASWSGRLSRAIPIDELLLQLAEILKPALDLSAIEIWLAAEHSLKLAVALPEGPRRRVPLRRGDMDALTRHTVTGRGWAEIWAPDLIAGRGESGLRIAPSSFTGTLCGVLVAERPPSAPPPSEEDDGLLADAARRLGVLLHTARLDRELQASDAAVRARAAELAASRARLASAADDARQRIERDLHDGAQQHLLALTTKLELARQLRNGDRASLDELLDELHGDAADALGALRHLAHGIYPPSLVQHGLAPALQAAARHVGVGVRVLDEATSRYPTRVETAVYFCCLEALQNVSKHADATAVLVHMSSDADRLVVEIIDDGRGFPGTEDCHGRGILNMGDRIGAVGGSIDIASSPGAGTRVRLTVPLSEDQAPR